MFIRLLTVIDILSCLLPIRSSKYIGISSYFIRFDEIEEIPYRAVIFLANMYICWMDKEMIIRKYEIPFSNYDECFTKIEMIGKKCLEIIAMKEGEEKVKQMLEKQTEENTIKHEISRKPSIKYIKRKKTIVDKGKIGEKNVRYALDWLKKDEFTIISPDEGSSLNIKNPEFSDESQEFDHIVVSDGVVFLIETKNLYGNITIDKNGNWIREIKGNKKGMPNPVQQIRRHEKIIESLFINDKIRIISILCLANEETIIDGIENTDNLIILKCSSLAEYLETFVKKRVKNKKMSASSIVSRIKAYMI